MNTFRRKMLIVLKKDIEQLIMRFDAIQTEAERDNATTPEEAADLAGIAARLESVDEAMRHALKEG